MSGILRAVLVVTLLGVGLSAPAQVTVSRGSDGKIIYVRDPMDRAFRGGAIGSLPRGADRTRWYAYDPWIISFCQEEGVDPVLAKAVIWNESRHNWRATSPKHAKGLMQLMDATAAKFGLRGDPYDPVNNIHAGIKYLAYLQTLFNGNLIKIVAAYNAGEGAVARANGVPHFRETRDYVPRVLWTWDWIQRS